MISEGTSTDNFDTQGVKKKFMFVSTKAPYGTIYALEVLEMVMISAAFEQHAVIAFIDDGVFQIKKRAQYQGYWHEKFFPNLRCRCYGKRRC